MANHNQSSGPAIVSASLGGDKSHAELAAAKKVTEAGITMVVAAGNNNADACNYSPADAGGKNGDVVTVASSDKAEHRPFFFHGVSMPTASADDMGRCSRVAGDGRPIRRMFLMGYPPSALS